MVASRTERWPDTQVMTEGAFGMEWRKHTPNNDATQLSFRRQRNRRARLGEGAGNQVVHEPEFRLACCRNWDDRLSGMVIDSRATILPAHEPETLQREWSLMNVLNQKGTRPQDKPSG